jgi:hypothetical protein
MSGALDPIQEDLPLELGSGSGSLVPQQQRSRPSEPDPGRQPSLLEQLITQLRALPWSRWRSSAGGVLGIAGHQLGGAAKVVAGRGGTVARLAAIQGGAVARVAVKRGAPYTLKLAKATAQISFIRALPLLVARTIHLFGFPAVVLRTALQFAIAHRAGLAIDEINYFRVDDPAGYTVYEAPPKLGTAIAITYMPTLVLFTLAIVCLAPALTPRSVLGLQINWVTWVQVWLGLSFAAHALPSYEEAGPVAEQARVGVAKADPVSVFWVIPAQIAAVLTRFGGILPAVAGVLASWYLAQALFQ